MAFKALWMPLNSNPTPRPIYNPESKRSPSRISDSLFTSNSTIIICRCFPDTDRSKNGRNVHVVDSELNRYVDLAKQIFSIPAVNETYLPHAQEIGNKLILYYSGINPQAKDPAMRAVTGEEYLVLPLNKNGNNVSVPEMSIHFLIMHLLGMLSRYQPEEWGEIIKGEETGEIYIVRKFLETTTRKFPNLILNELQNRNFVFVSRLIDRGDKANTKKIHRKINPPIRLPQ